MKEQYKSRGMLRQATRLRSSANGNPRYEVQIDGGVYRTKPDSDFAYDVPNLLDQFVEVTWCEYHGWPTILYGGKAWANTILDSPLRDKPIVAAGNKPEDNTPARLPEEMKKQILAEHNAPQPADRFKGMSAGEIYETLKKEEEEYVRKNPHYALLLDSVDLMERLKDEKRYADAATLNTLINEYNGMRQHMRSQQLEAWRNRNA